MLGFIDDKDATFSQEKTPAFGGDPGHAGADVGIVSVQPQDIIVPVF